MGMAVKTGFKFLLGFLALGSLTAAFDATSAAERRFDHVISLSSFAILAMLLYAEQRPAANKLVRRWTLRASANELGILLGIALAAICIWQEMERHQGIWAVVLGALAVWAAFSAYAAIKNLQAERDMYATTLREHKLFPYDRT
jgi:hypothetical protein